MLEIAIIGAGPYGLSVAAHLKRQGIAYRIFGRPMDSWLRHMPQGMLLKSDGFASNISDPEDQFTLKQFCAERGIDYSDLGLPIQLETFSAYGLAFAQRMVPELEEKLVVHVDRAPGGFLLRTADGETVSARRVILAIGITHFDYLPSSLANVSPELLSHSSRHRDLERFRGRSIVVIGGGASGTDLASALAESGANVQLVARQKSLKFHSKPTPDQPRSWWQRLRYPHSGLGPGLRSRFFANAPSWFYYLPQHLRVELVRTQLGPSGGWFSKEKVVGRVPLLLGYTPLGVQMDHNGALLRLRASDGTEREVLTEHIIAATGYRVNLERLQFLSTNLRSSIKTVSGAPVLSTTFESSTPGLYFVGIAAANSFGPVMRFAFGAAFAAKQVTKAMTKMLERGRASTKIGYAPEIKNEQTGAL